MSQELRTFTINLKSMDQDIPDPIIAGAGDANGRTFRIIFDQEAKAQLTPETKIYLSWFHKQEKNKGYNAFKQVDTDPVIWEIKWPQDMLHEGDVLCCIEMVDDISIVQSVTFLVHVLSNPNDSLNFIISDDFSEFQNAIIQLNSIADKMTSQMEQQKLEFENMTSQFNQIKESADLAYAKSTEAIDRIAALEKQLENMFPN